MINVLLVDDNRMALTYFSALIDWEKYGFSLAATAIDGEAALIEFEKIRPEIVITDVQMPVMDGIELTRRVLALAPETVVLFLSSYEEFSYIRSAMDLNVYAYILKHETKAPDLIARLLEIKTMLQKRKRESHYIAQGNLSYLLTLNDPADPTGKQQFFQFFPGRYHLLAAFQDRFVPAVEKIFSERLSETAPIEPIAPIKIQEFFYQYEEAEAILKLEDGAYLVLLQANDKLIEYAYQCKNDFYAQFHQTLSLIILAEDTHIVDALKQYQEKKRLLNQKYFYPPSTILYGTLLRPRQSLKETLSGEKTAKKRPSEENPAKENLLKERLPKERLPKEKLPEPEPLLSEQTLAENPEKACRLLDERFRSAIVLQDYDACSALLEDCVRALLPYHQNLPDTAGRGLFEVYNDRSHLSWMDIPSAFSWLKERYSAFSNLWMENSRHRYSGAARKTVLFLYQNYANCDLSAEDVADNAGYPVNRLNQLLKKELSSTIWQLLTKIRMEKARDLLDRTDLKISEVSEASGYRAISHFSNVFKKYYGISPQEYRKKEQL